MQHGGPWPASTDARFTSVGTAAIQRLLRPVCFQDAPQACCPRSCATATRVASCAWWTAGRCGSRCDRLAGGRRGGRLAHRGRADARGGGGLAVAGRPQPGAAPDDLRREQDHLRSAVVLEPRGHDAWWAPCSLRPSSPARGGGVIFFNNVGYLGMCGHGHRRRAHAGAPGPAHRGSRRWTRRSGPCRAELGADGAVTIRTCRPTARAATWRSRCPAWAGSWATSPGAATGSSSPTSTGCRRSSMARLPARG